jgi:long-chain acyl-CoA synthetase
MEPRFTDPKHHPARIAHGIMPSSARTPYLNWGSLMRHNDSTYLEKPWMIYIDDLGATSTWSYSIFIDVSRRIASILRQEGIRRGDRIAIASHNHPDTILCYFACWLIGACAVPLNMTEDDQRISYIITHSGVKSVLCKSDYLARLSSMCADHGVDVLEMDSDAADSQWYQRIRATDAHEYPEANMDMRFDDCMVVYTSGTTGNPKGVVLMQQCLFSDCSDIIDWYGISDQTRMMCVLPVHHVNGSLVTHATPFLAGGSVVLQRKFSPRTFFSSIKEHHVQIVSVVPTLLAFLLDAKADASGVVESGFAHIICGAGPLTCELAERFESQYRIRITHGYGLSETTCYTCFLPTGLTDDEHHHWMQSHGFPSIGVAIPANEMAIHDPSGNPVPDGERGEIVIRGTNIMRGYDANPVANAEAFAYGWFRSGDEGFRIADARWGHFYFITGRLKELIIRGGVNLAPLEIDEVINRAPGVQAGICVGFENNMYGEEVGALVLRSTEQSTEAEILEYCQQHLPFAKAPKVVLFTDQLPVTSTGKYQRNKVKHLFAQWKDTQFRKA